MKWGRILNKVHLKSSLFTDTRTILVRCSCFIYDILKTICGVCFIAVFVRRQMVKFCTFSMCTSAVL